MAIEEPTAPWMIRSFPVASRERFVQKAQSQDMTTAEWVLMACNNEFSRAVNSQIIAPDKRDEPAPHATINIPLDMAGAAALVQVLLTADGQGKAVKGALRETIATIRVGMREARGVPPRRAVKQIGQTIEG